MAAELVATGGVGLCSPHFDAEGTLWMVSRQTGEVLRLVRDGEQLAIAVAFAAGVQPSSLAVHPVDGTILLADLGHKSVLAVSPQGQTSDFVREYEQQPFIGPSALSFDGKRNLYLCDAGPLGETGLHSPKGSVFVVSSDGQLLLPLTLESLAYPSALALAPAPDAAEPAPFVYVAEMAANRIVRFARRPVDVFVGSVFFQFAGGAGPSALLCAPDGTLFVGHFDFVQGGGATQQGKISKLSPRGELLEELFVPAPEISGLALKGRTLYVTESSTNSLFAIEL
mmetsp:Transcript_12825/g.30164  ORF Transcript_12825/g.30164 Transcript_12825/m.30164 type:complete len:283 (+) Transcript_12825:2-850(+)